MCVGESTGTGASSDELIFPVATSSNDTVDHGVYTGEKPVQVETTAKEDSIATEHVEMSPSTSDSPLETSQSMLSGVHVETATTTQQEGADSNTTDSNKTNVDSADVDTSSCGTDSAKPPQPTNSTTVAVELRQGAANTASTELSTSPVENPNSKSTAPTLPDEPPMNDESAGTENVPKNTANTTKKKWILC